jgi:TonB-dependent receptor
MLCSTSLVTALAATSVWAQDVAAAAEPSTDKPKAEKSTGKATAADKEAAEGASEIVVTGFRAALGSAQDQKRASDSIIDTVVAEDIGKVPDNNGAEVLSRIAGVQITRTNDEGSEVLVRGLPNLATTYNDRELFSTDDRVLHWQDISAAVAQGYEVYKTATSNLVEPGLGGLINIRSRRPFDMKDTTVAGEVKGSYNDQTKTFEPSGNLIAAHTWDTSIGQLGVLVGGSYIRTKYQQAIRFDGAAIITNTDNRTCNDSTVLAAGEFCMPDYIGNFIGHGTRERPAANFMVQWKPNADLEIYAEGLWSGYRGTQANDFYGQTLRGGTLSNVVLFDGEAPKAASLTHSGGGSPDIWRDGLKDRTDVYQGAAGFKWHTGRATITGDFAYSKSVYEATKSRVISQLPTVPTVNANFQASGSGVFDLNGYDMLNPDAYTVNAIYQTHLIAKGDGWQGRIDTSLDTDIGWLPKLQVGVRATRRTSQDNYGDRYMWIGVANVPTASLPTGALEQIHGNFRGDPQRFRSWLAPNGKAIIANFEALRQFAVTTGKQIMAQYDWAGFEQGAIDQFSTPAIQDNPSSTFYGTENTIAAYAQGKYQFDLGGIHVDGTGGVRIAWAEGNSIVQQTAINPGEAKHDWLNVLPAFQARAHLTDQVLLRLAYTKTISRPGYAQVAPTVQADRVNGPFPVSSIYTGNPYLKPLRSTNYDASLEYYFSKHGSASLAVFYKDIWGFIDTYGHAEKNPTDPTSFIEIYRPENAGSGRIKGAEASVQTFFDFLPGWLSGFGVQANLTYLDAKNAMPAPSDYGSAGAFASDSPGKLVPLINASKWTYNIAAMYEKGPISARVSYNRRSAYGDNYKRLPGNEQYSGQLTKAVSRLDASISYQVSKNISVVATGNNLLAQPWNDYTYYTQHQYYPNDTRVEGRYLSLGVRFKM